MSFNPDDTRLTEYVFGELQGAERDQFEAELAWNDALRQAVDSLRATVDAVAEVLAAEPHEGLQPQQRSKVQAAIAGAGAERRESEPPGSGTRPLGPRQRRRKTIAALAMAASLLLACGLGYQLGRGQVTQVAAARHGSVPSTAKSSDTHNVHSTDELSVSPAHTGGEQQAVKILQEGVAVPLVATAVSPDGPHPPSSYHLEAGIAKPADAAPPANEPTPYWVAPAAAGQRAGAQISDSLHLQRGTAVAPPFRQNSFRSYAEEYVNPRFQYAGIPAGADGQSAHRQGVYGGGGLGGGPGRGLSGSGIMMGTERLNELAAIKQAITNGAEQQELLRELKQITDRIHPGEGLGPGSRGDQYLPIVENPFREAINSPLSTFSIDVDTASYAKTRMYLLEQNGLPRPDAVRVEEMLNYFVYDYAPPEDERPFAANVETATCPWAPQHRLVRIALKGREIPRDERPTSNLVFLLDVSGSMRPENKLPLVKRGMKQLVDQLGENDRVAIVVYAGAAGMVLEPTPCSEKQRIIAALDQLQAGGSTNGGQGIHLAYKTARENFFEEGVNRVILCTDGDFNVGTTGTDQLVELAKENAKTGVFLSVLGFGMGNHNDAMLEQVSNQGNGNYAFIDTPAEARKVLVEQLSGTLVTIAKDVKIQVEMNPARVAAYRLIGYENRVLAAEDFNDDKKDAGEIGAGHSVTALYEIVPAGEQLAEPPAEVDELKYQVPARLSEAAESDELLTLKLRYKQPDGDTSQLIRFPVRDEGSEFEKASRDFQFASAVASFGMLLRGSNYRGNATYDAVLEIATAAAGEDPTGYRRELLEMVRRAKELTPVPPAATDEPVSEE